MIEKISPIPSFPKRGIRKKGSFPRGNTAEGFHAKERGPTEEPEGLFFETPQGLRMNWTWGASFSIFIPTEDEQ